ncbi:MAG: hypothetical protein MI919_29410 [Holophagales bacterium]|nr:hypothetical protein [Holophagales bacterium]
MRLAPDLIEVRGTVYSVEDPHAAERTLASTLKGSISVTTDEEGGFEVFSLEPQRSVSIHWILRSDIQRSGSGNGPSKNEEPSVGHHRRRAANHRGALQRRSVV